MKWFKRTDPEVETAVDELKTVRAKRRSALKALICALDEVRIDDGLVKIGDDLLKPQKGAD